MKCSDCQSELKQIDYRGIKINECENCKGRWFNKEELRKAKDKTDDDLRWLDFDPFGEEGKSKVAKRGKKCPECSEEMDTLTYNDSKVKIDKCPKCEGVWLDHGEFEKIIKYLEKIIITESSSEYAKDVLKQFLEIATGSESKASEVKDFLVVLKLLEQRTAAENPKIANLLNKIYQYSPFK